MTPPARTALELSAALSWFWMLHLSYLLRNRYHWARHVVSVFKFLFGKRNEPDSVLRDWLTGMYFVITFLFVILVWSSAIEYAAAPN